MPPLSLALLGPPVARLAGQPLSFRTRKALALLVYLAVEPGPHARDALALLLWPEHEAGAARMLLRTALAHLRQALGPAAGDYVLAERDSLGLNPAGLELDLALVEAAARALRAGPPAAAAEQCAAALAAYRGDFLSGLDLADAPEFEAWAGRQREGWHRRLTVLFDALSQTQAEAGQLPSALETAARWVAHDPLHEPAYRRLMQLHFAAGDRAAALQAYAACLAALQRELHTTPDPETTALARRLEQAAAPRPALARAGPAGPPTPQHLLAALPMVGRAVALAGLISASYAARRAQTQAVLVEGEAGIGKTRLAAEFSQWAAAEGLEVWAGRAFETSGRLPYQPVLDALRPRLERENAPDDLLSDTWLAELSRLLPELRDRYPDLPPPLLVGEGETQSRLFEAVARLGQALAARRPAIFCLDDAQWADAASRDLLLYAARRWAAEAVPVLLLCLVRADLSPAVSAWLADLGRAAPLTRLALGTLTADHTLQAVQALAGQAAPTAAVRAFAAWLHQETDGQPFFLTEMLKALVEQGALTATLTPAGAWALDVDGLRDPAALRGLLPTGVRELIRARLVRLSPPAADLLAAGAVVGQAVDFTVLCDVAGVSEADGLRALDELLAARLLLETPAAAGPQYLFAHDKLREVVYAEAGEARRRVFHRRALAALEAAGQPPAVLARHALAAGQEARALALCLAAGDAALRVFAVHDAVAFYTQAEKLLGPAPAPAALFQLYRQLGRAYELLADLPQARRAYETLLAAARAHHHAPAEVAALNRLGTLTAHELHVPTALNNALALLAEARRLAEAAGDLPGLAETEWNLAQTNFYGWRVAAATTHGEQALRLARALRADVSPEEAAARQDLLGRCANALGYSKLIAGRFAEAEAHALEAQAIYAALGNRALEIDSLCVAVEAQTRSGQLLTGLASARRARALSLEIENLWGRANTAYHLGLALWETGALAEALRVTTTGVATAQAAGYVPMRIFSLLTHGNVLRALFALPQARAVHLEAQEVNLALPPEPFTEAIYSELCADAVLAADWPAAHMYARQALAVRDNAVLVNGLNRWCETLALVRGGDLALAAADLDDYYAHVHANARRVIDWQQARAVLRAAQGDTASAEADLRAALRGAEAYGLPLVRLALHAALGELAPAQALVAAIAAELDPPERDRFLAAEPVQRLQALWLAARP